MKAKTNKLGKLQKNIRRYSKLAVIPHKANHYRPHLIRRYGLLVVLICLATFQAGYNFLSTGAVLGGMTTTTVELFEQTNEERRKHRVKPLQFDERLNRAAYLKAQHMFSRQYWSHTAPDGTTPWYWLREVNYNYAYAGENLAKDFRSGQEVLAAWMGSSEHRQNVLNTQFSQVGFAVVSGVLNGKNTTLVVGLYGAPIDHAVNGLHISSGAAAEVAPANIATQLGSMLLSLSPAVIGSIAILIVLTGIALLAHVYRSKLPKNLRRTWYRHHGLIKSGGMLALIVIMILLRSGGQI